MTEAASDTAPTCYGHIIIEWPAPRGTDYPRLMPGWACAIFDAATGKPVTTAEKLVIPAVTVDARRFITAELTMLADEDGNPVFDGNPHVRDGEIITATFPFLVAEMRVAGQTT